MFQDAWNRAGRLPILWFREFHGSNMLQSFRGRSFVRMWGRFLSSKTKAALAGFSLRRSMSAFGTKRTSRSCVSHESILGRSMKWLAFSTNGFAFTGVLLALSYKARFGRSMKWLALSTNCLAFARLRHRGGDKARGDQSNKKYTRHRYLRSIPQTISWI